MGKEIEAAAQLLRQGALVAFPTETVYGLGADARNGDALRRLYAVKGRPLSHPVIVHIHCLDELSQWAVPADDAAYRLAEAFWPGPMTLVLPRAEGVSDLVTGGQASIGVRMPGHKVALDLLAEFGTGVAAPSANRFGRISPTTAADVLAELGSDVSMVLDGGPCQVGIESTIIDLSSASPQILRPGMILPEDIERVLGHGTHLHTLQCVAGAVPAIRAPGGLPSHYAPEAELRLVASDSLASTIDCLRSQGKRLAVVAFGAGHPLVDGRSWLAASRDPVVYARDIYGQLRYADRTRPDVILVESPPSGGLWEPIRDRLTRAAGPR